MDLTGDVAAAVVRGMGAFIRATPAAELPPKLKRFKRFDRPQALMSQRKALLEALDSDELTRARIAEWMADGKPPLKAAELELLRLVAGRPDGWDAALAEAAGASRPPAKKETPKDYERMLVREKERTAKAKEELRRTREELRTALKDEEARSAALESALQEARDEVAELRARVSAAEQAALDAARSTERAERKSRAAVERATAKEKALREELRAVRRELKQATDAAARSDRPRARAAPRPGPGSRKTGKRRRLKAPKGRFETDPETLEAWLAVDDVRLLVDGYNVTKAEGGFGDVALSQQRRRLIEGVGKLARKKKIPATIVFDGSDVPPGTSRRPADPVTVEYSKPEEIADDHLVARLESFDAVPVVVVTNDKELQHRAATLGATIASSNQLLALIR
jgi:predicted RNA-binding protein with PIN domain